eukprot:m51a1_g11227 hypothetical protein (157) ;mRNA; r:21044-21514
MMSRAALVALCVLAALAAAEGAGREGRSSMQIALRTAHGRYVTVFANGTVQADAPAAGDRERFTMQHSASVDGAFTLRTAHNAFVGAAPGGRVVADVAVAGESEAWEVRCDRVVQSRCAFVSARGGLYLGATAQHEVVALSLADHAPGTETFAIEY